MAKLYNVRIEYEVVVLAEDEDEAFDAASEALDDIDVHDHGTVEALLYMPFGWTGTELPFTANRDVPERTVNEWIEAGAAPEMAQRMAEKRRTTSAPTAKGEP